MQLFKCMLPCMSIFSIQSNLYDDMFLLSLLIHPTVPFTLATATEAVTRRMVTTTALLQCLHAFPSFASAPWQRDASAVSERRDDSSNLAAVWDAALWVGMRLALTTSVFKKIFLINQHKSTQANLPLHPMLTLRTVVEKALPARSWHSVEFYSQKALQA